MGRVSERAAIDGFISEKKSGQSVVVNIYGGPATGKTSLALLVAHARARTGRFHIYLDLQSSRDLLVIRDALSGVLGLAGIPRAELPSDIQLLSMAFQNTLLEGGATVVLDNVASGNIARLFRSSDWSGSTILMTSFAPLASLDGALLLELPAMGVADSRALLQNVSGRSLDSGDQANVDHIAGICDHLPLAMRISGALLLTRPRWTWASLSKTLGNEDARLRELSVDDMSITASFNVAFRALEADEQRVISSLGLLAGRVIRRPLADALAGFNHANAERIIDRLIDSQMISSLSPDTIELHSLVWLFAREKGEALPSDQVAFASGAVKQWAAQELKTQYLASVVATYGRVPSPDGMDSYDLGDVFVPPQLICIANNRVVELQTILEELSASTHRKALVLGSGGSGKSAAVGFLAAQGDRVPFVLLGREIIARLGVQNKSVIAAIREELAARFNVELSLAQLSDVLDSLPFLVFIDSIDEIPSVTDRTLLGRLVDEFLTRFTNADVVLTSRPYNGLEGDATGVEVYALSPLEPDRVRTLFDRYAQVKGIPVPSALIRMHSRSESETPLSALLRLEAAIQGSLNDSTRLEVLEAVLRFSGTQRESRRGIMRADISQYAETLAFVLQSSTQSRSSIGEGELAVGIRNALDWGAARTAPDSLGVLREMDPWEILAALRPSHGTAPFLVEYHGNEGVRLGFVHSIYREYFAALFLYRQLAMRTDSLASILELVQQQVDDASWVEVLEFLVELVDRRSPNSEMYRGMLDLKGGVRDLLIRVAGRLATPSAELLGAL